MTGSYDVGIDRSKNRLYLELDGMLDEETAEAHVDDMLAAADDLESGFDMVNDISAFTPMDQDTSDVIEQGKEGLTERGVSAVVRVTGESVVGKLQFDRVSPDSEGYHVATAETTDAAERLLDEFRGNEE